MRHILTFRTSYPESGEYEHPRGYGVCQFLYERLRETGLDVDEPDNYRDIAWSVDCRIDSKKVFFFVGYLGTQCTEWQLIVCSDIGWIGRMLGRRDDEARMKLAQAVHSVLSTDERFSDLKWYSRYTDTPKDVAHAQPYD